MTKVFKIFILLLASTGCQHQPELKKNISNLYFPYGKFEQKIFISIPKNDEQFSFQGWLVRKKDRTVIVGLSPFGSTLFKVTDIHGQPSTFEIYVDQLKPHKQRIRNLFLGLVPVLKEKKGIVPKGFTQIAAHRQTHFRSNDKQLEVKLLGFEETGDPYRTTIIHSTGWEVKIATISYTAL